MVYQYTLSFSKYYGSSYAAIWAVGLLDSTHAKTQVAASAQFYMMWGLGLRDPSAQVKEQLHVKHKQELAGLGFSLLSLHCCRINLNVVEAV